MCPYYVLINYQLCRFVVCTCSLFLQKFNNFWTEKFANGSWARVTSFWANNFSEILSKIFGAQSTETSIIVSMILQGASSRKIVEILTFSSPSFSPSFFDGGTISSNDWVICLKRNLHKLLQSDVAVLEVTSRRHWRPAENVSKRNFSATKSFIHFKFEMTSLLIRCVEHARRLEICFTY